MSSPTDLQRGIDGLIQEARAAERESRHAVARGRYQAALYRLGRLDNGPLPSALLRWIGRTHAAESDLDAALDCYGVAFAVAEICGATADAAHALNCEAIVLFQRGQLDDATERYQRARELAETAGERTLIAMIDQNLGNVANVQGDHDLAYARYQSSLMAYRELGLEEYVGPVLTNMGRVHTDLGEWEDAERILEQAGKSCDRLGNASYRILVDVNRARMWLNKGDLARGRDASDAALEGAVQLKDERWLGEIHKIRGTIHRRAGRPRLAERSLAEALEHAERQEDLLLQAEVCREIAQILQAEERNQELLTYLNRAHGVFGKLHARRDLADVQRRIAQLEQEFLEIVGAWGASIESKDLYTQGHCVRVADLACRLAEAAGLDEGSLRWFRMGALLHDVGKVEVPSEILNKPGPLSDTEWEVMKGHPEAGVALLSDVSFPWDIRPMVLHHHERWDGRGYPAGLRGQDIPLSARILCVADVFDALTTTRSYRAAFSPEVALEVMAGDAGHVFDPHLFDHFQKFVVQRGKRLDPRESWLWTGSGALGGDALVDRQPPLQLLA